MPSAHVIRLCGSGALAVEGPVAAGGRAVSRAAQLLESMLPPRDAGPEFKVPGALRLCIVRALGTLDVPPYPSLDSFADALQRFAVPDAAATIRGLVEAWDATTAAAPVADAVKDPAPPPPEERRRADPHRRPDREHFTQSATPQRNPGALTISDIRRARRATGLALGEISVRSRIPVPLLRQLEWGYLRNWPSGLYGRTQLVRYARAAGLDDQIVIATVWPMLDEVERADREAVRVAAPALPAAAVSPDRVAIDVADTPLDRPGVPEHAVSTGSAGATGVRRRMGALAAVAAALLLIALPLVRDRFEAPSEQASDRIDSTIAARERPAESEPSGPHVPDPVRQDRTEPRAPLPRARAVTPTSGQAEPQAGPARASGSAPAPAGMAEPARGLTDEETAWSPAFAAVGSAMFYHAQADGREGSSALMRADTDSGGAILRITRVVDDDARNFHARPSPDGTRIAFDSDRDGERGVYVADADGTNVRRVSGEGYSAVPAWSPGGRVLVFVRAEPDRPRVWNLWTVDLETGQMQRLTSHRYGQPWGGSWFPDGRRLAYSHETRLVVLDVETGRERVYPSPRKGQLVRTPAVSPDGRRIIFQVHRDGAWLLDLQDGSMRKILADPTAEEYTWSPDGRRVAYHSRKSGEWGVWLMVSR